MKKLITIIFALVSLNMSAQVANYKANSLSLLQSLQSEEISKDAYIDIARMQIDGLKENTQFVEVKPRYNATLDLSILAGGVLYQKFAALKSRTKNLIKGSSTSLAQTPIYFLLRVIGCLLSIEL